MSVIELKTRVTDGEALASLYCPEGGEGLPLVVMFADAFGPQPDLNGLAEELSQEGYAVLVPDPFWRLRPYDAFDRATAFGDPSERTRLFGLLAKVSFDDVLGDTKAAVDSLSTYPRVKTDKIGAMGYCMGGRFAFLSAIRWPEKIVAAASIHGGGLVTPKFDSPHLAVSSVKAELYFAVADNDAGCSPETQGTLVKALAEQHIRYALELYPNAVHGFGVPGTPIYDAAATARYWGRVHALFAANLRR